MFSVVPLPNMEMRETTQGEREEHKRQGIEHLRKLIGGLRNLFGNLWQFIGDLTEKSYWEYEKSHWESMKSHWVTGDWAPEKTYWRSEKSLWESMTIHWGFDWEILLGIWDISLWIYEISLSFQQMVGCIGWRFRVGFTTCLKFPIGAKIDFSVTDFDGWICLVFGLWFEGASVPPFFSHSLHAVSVHAGMGGVSLSVSQLAWLAYHNKVAHQ